MYYPAFIYTRQTGNPDYNDNYQKTGDKQEPNGEWPYKRSRFHSNLKFGCFVLGGTFFNEHDYITKINSSWANQHTFTTKHTFLYLRF